MRTTKVVFIGTILVAALIVTMIGYGAGSFERSGASALAAHGTNTRQTASFVTDPIKPAETAVGDKITEASIRTVDW
jgi:archaellum component FlaG (FlaF/FlaG flagellin family)